MDGGVAEARRWLVGGVVVDSRHTMSSYRGKKNRMQKRKGRGSVRDELTRHTWNLTQERDR